MPSTPPSIPPVAAPHDAAPDPVTRLVLAEAAASGPPVGLAATWVVGDVDGALVRSLRRGASEVPGAGAAGHLRVWVDDLREARAAVAAGGVLAGPERDGPEADRTGGDGPEGDGPEGDGPGPPGTNPVELVLGRLPTSLSALDDLAEQLARRLAAGGRVLLGGRIKHMTRAQNDVLARHFTEVTASLGHQKCRVLHAAGPRPPASPRWPRAHLLDDPVLGEPLPLVGRGAVFAAGRLDAGTRLLLQTLGPSGPAPGRALDLGCGSGVIALWLARRGHRVGASDVSAAAVDATRRSAVAAGLDVAVRWADGVEGVPAGSLDLLVSNPPFHRGAAKDSKPTLQLIDAAAPVLAPGGELWLVWNAHLPYLPRLRQRVGPTEVVARDRHYLVTRSRPR